MKIHHIGHASYFFETTNKRIIMDPLFFDPFEEGANVSYPQRTVDIGRFPAIDIIIISHRHFDHFDLRTLSLFDRNIPCVIPQGDEMIRKGLHILGYKHIREVDAGTRIKIGATIMTFTPSNVPFPEMGVIIQDDMAKVWNCVDAVIDQEIVKEFINVSGKIECILATYNPLIQFELRSNQQHLFPFERYKNLVENVVAASPRIVVPSACGLRYPIGSWQNHLGFPMTPQRFMNDIASIDSSLECLRLFPGDVLEINAGEYHYSPGNASYISCDHQKSADCAEWNPDPSIGIDTFSDLNPLGHSAKDIVKRAKHYIEEIFLADLETPECQQLLETLRQWRVKWQLDLYAPPLKNTGEMREDAHSPYDDFSVVCPKKPEVTCEILSALRRTSPERGLSGPIHSWLLDFSQSSLQWSSEPIGFINLHTAIAASGIVDALDGNITYYNFCFTDRFRFSQRVYLAQSSGMSTPEQSLEEPLSTVLALHYDFDMLYVQNKALYWLNHDPIRS